jgi:hypothetical protein
MARLGIERLELARAPLHIQQDAGLAALAQVGRAGDHRVLPAHRTRSERRRWNRPQKIPPPHLPAANRNVRLNVNAMRHKLPPA